MAELDVKKQEVIDEIKASGNFVTRDELHVELMDVLKDVKPVRMSEFDATTTSQKAIVAVVRTVSALTRKTPFAACIKLFFNSIVTTLRSPGSPDLAATAMATSISVRRTPPCATAQVFVCSGLRARRISPLPISALRHRTPSNFKNGTFNSSPKLAS